MTDPNEPSTPSRLDECMVCNTTREDHGDKQHLFSTDGRLEPKPKNPEPKQKAPRLRAENADRDQVVDDLKQDMQANAVLRLTEVLIGKGLLDSSEVMYIFSGHKTS